MTTTLPLESHKDRSLFLENERKIGRAYRNRALELISICQLISQTASPKCVHEYAELKRTLRVCDIALRSATDSDSKDSDKANTRRFMEATQTLSTYSKITEPSRGFPIHIYTRTEEAKRKDSVKSVWSHVAKRATLLLPKSKDERGPTMTINFLLLRSRLLVSGGPDTILASQEFSASPSLPEILWNFSRYDDRARITLEQNPHFYVRCPTDESAYTPTFQCHPLQGPGIEIEHNGTVYVLLDGPSRVFLDIGPNLRIFGNVWSLNGVLIFRDHFGVLQGEQLVRGSSVRGKLWYCEQQVVLNDSKSCSRLNHCCLPPIVTTPSADHQERGIFEDWLALNHLALPSISIHIYESGGSLTSINSLDLPPPPPTSELPEYPVQYMSANRLDDDVLSCIFNHYRLEEENDWNDHLGWRKLSHVCRRWRHLVHCSAIRLGMHIRCTNGTPIVGTLDHLPPLPLFIDYQDTTAPITPQDELAIGHALLLRDRVRHIDLRLPPSILHTFLPLMNEPFSMLEYFFLSCANRGDPNLVLPKALLAPNLRHLSLVGIDIPKRLRFLTSTVSLVTLVLTNIRAPGYFLPRLLAARLQSLPQLEIFSVGFADPIPRPCAQRELSSKRGATVTLPNLKHLAYQGVSAYLECLVAQIRTPLLERLEITLFNQIALELPHLSHFTNIIEGLKLPIAKVSFGRNTVSVITDHHKLQQYDGGISLHVICRQMDWQIDCAAQICNALIHMLNGVENLRLIFYDETMPTEWEDGEIDGTTWHELLRVFAGVKELHVCPALLQELSRALQVDDVLGSDPGFLPSLQDIVSEFEGSDAEKLFSSFIGARRIAGNPVRYLKYYPFKARALYAYTASPDDPNELSFSKGDILGIIDKTGKWWQAGTEDGIRGTIPSNYVQIVDSTQRVKSSNAQTIEQRQPARSSHVSDLLDPPFKARAQWAYTADPDDPDELSFSKGDIFDIIGKTGKWWQAETKDGARGIIPSNCIRIVDRQQLAEFSNVQTVERHQPTRSSIVSDLPEPPFKARALYAYIANPDDPKEISFAKGENLDIINIRGKWWEAQKEDGTSGVAPSNYLQIPQPTDLAEKSLNAWHRTTSASQPRELLLQRRNHTRRNQK